MNVFFHTFGCKANQYDTEQVRQAFAGAGATVVDDPAAADVAVVNSCTVTGESEAPHEADHPAFGEIGRAHV